MNDDMLDEHRVSVHMYTSLCTCTHLYIHLHISLYIYISPCTSISVQQAGEETVNMHGGAEFVCVCVSVCVCVCVCVGGHDDMLD